MHGRRPALHIDALRIDTRAERVHSPGKNWPQGFYKRDSELQAPYLLSLDLKHLERVGNDCV